MFMYIEIYIQYTLYDVFNNYPILYLYQCGGISIIYNII